MIDIPAEQAIELRATCEREGISRAEAVRRAIALYVAQPARQTQQQAMASGFGLWQKRPASIDSLCIQ